MAKGIRFAVRALKNRGAARSPIKAIETGKTYIVPDQISREDYQTLLIFGSVEPADVEEAKRVLALAPEPKLEETKPEPKTEPTTAEGKPDRRFKRGRRKKTSRTE